MRDPHNVPRPPTPPLRCACGGEVVLTRLRPSTPLVPACRVCATPTPAAKARLAS